MLLLIGLVCDAVMLRSRIKNQCSFFQLNDIVLTDFIYLNDNAVNLELF